MMHLPGLTFAHGEDMEIRRMPIGRELFAETR